MLPKPLFSSKKYNAKVYRLPCVFTHNLIVSNIAYLILWEEVQILVSSGQDFWEWYKDNYMYEDLAEKILYAINHS